MGRQDNERSSESVNEVGLFQVESGRRQRWIPGLKAKLDVHHTCVLEVTQRMSNSRSPSTIVSVSQLNHRVSIHMSKIFMPTKSMPGALWRHCGAECGHLNRKPSHVACEYCVAEEACPCCVPRLCRNSRKGQGEKPDSPIQTL